MKNKTYVGVLALCGLTMGAQAQEKFKIAGLVEPEPKNQVMHLYFYKPGTQELVHDSCRVEQGNFQFEGDLSATTLGFLAVPPDNMRLNEYMARNGKLPSEQLGIYLEKGTIIVHLKGPELSSAVISGTPENDAVQEARPIIWKYKTEEEEISETLMAAGEDIAQREKIVALHTQMVAERTLAVGEYIKDHPSALASLDLLKRWVNPLTETKAAAQFYGYLSEDLKKSSSAQRYAGIIEQANKLAIGAVAPNFNLPDTKGKLHSLTEYRGKYILLDFWASWCIPCRQENPNLIKSYNRFKDRNFEIVGVSLDGGKANAHEKWTEAIEKDGLTWTQLSDLEGWNSVMTKLYQVSSIPMNYLLDPDGKIIAKNMRGEELTQTLKKYL